MTTAAERQAARDRLHREMHEYIDMAQGRGPLPGGMTRQDAIRRWKELQDEMDVCGEDTHHWVPEYLRRGDDLQHLGTFCQVCGVRQ